MKGIKTGMLDKQGREVCEGDVYSYVMVIEYSNESKQEIDCVDAITLEDGEFYHGVHLLADVIEYDESLVYVGNIYDNPELLEGAK